MVTVEAVAYIKSQLQKGLRREQIENALTANGWQSGDIQEAFRMVESEVPAAGGAPVTTELPGPIALFQESWSIYLSLIWRFFRSNLITGALTVSSTLLILLAIGIIVLLTILHIPSPFNIIIMLIGLPVFIFILVVVNILEVWGEAADIELLKDRGEKIGAIEAFKRSKHLLIPFFIVQFLFGLLVVGGFYFFVIPGLLYSIWFMFCDFIIIVEGERGLNALLKSREYIRGKFWPVLGRALFIGGFALLIQLVLELFSYTIGFENLSAATYGGITALITIAISFVFIFIISFFAPLVITYLFLLYMHLKQLKGQFVFQPTRKTKLLYVLPSILGIPLLMGTIFLIAFISVAMHKVPTNGSSLSSGYPGSMPSKSVSSFISPLPAKESSVVPPSNSVDSQLAKARDTQRKSDLTAVLNSIESYMSAHNGTLPATFSSDPSNPTILGSNVGKGEVDLCAAFVPSYISDIPVDPKNGTPLSAPHCKQAGGTGAYDSGGYKIYQSVFSQSIIGEATSESTGEIISVSAPLVRSGSIAPTVSPLPNTPSPTGATSSGSTSGIMSH